VCIIGVLEGFAAIDCARDKVVARQLLENGLLKRHWLGGLNATVHSNRLLGVIGTLVLRIPSLKIPDSASGAFHVRHLDRHAHLANGLPPTVVQLVDLVPVTVAALLLHHRFIINYRAIEISLFLNIAILEVFSNERFLDYARVLLNLAIYLAQGLNVSLLAIFL